MNKNDFVNAIKDLGLNPEDYIVIGSGILAALEIREASDVNIVVSESIFKILSQDNRLVKKELDDGSYILTKDIYEIGVDRKSRNAKPTLEELKRGQEIIDGIPFINLEWLKSFKAGHSTEKNLDDIMLIEQFFEDNSDKH